MAEKKSKKKDKMQKMSLNEFQLDWAAELEGSLPTIGSKALPDAPRSLLETDVNVDHVPLHGPFLLILENAPFEVTELEIEKFFAPIPLKNIDIQIEIGRRKMPQVELETRELVIRALKEKHNQDIGRRTIKLKNPDEVLRELGGRRDGGYNNRRDQDGGLVGNSDPNRPDVTLGNWRDNAPAVVAPQPMMRQPFDPNQTGGQVPFNRSQMGPFAGVGAGVGPPGDDRRNNPSVGRDPNFQIQRNMQIPYEETKQPAPRMQEDHRMMRNVDQQRPPLHQDRDFVISRSDHIAAPNMPLDRPYFRDGPVDFSRPPADVSGNTSYGPVPPSFVQHRSDRRFDDSSERGPFGGHRTGSSALGGSHSARDVNIRDQRRGGDDLVIQRSSIIPPPQSAPAAALVPPPSHPLPSLDKKVEPLRERPKLNLKPREESLANTEPVHSSSVFGGAKPVDTSAREREVEEKIRKEREAAHLAQQQKLQENSDRANIARSNEHDETSNKIMIPSEVSPRPVVLQNVAGTTRNADGRPVASVPPFRNQAAVVGSMETAQPRQKDLSEMHDRKERHDESNPGLLASSRKASDISGDYLADGGKREEGENGDEEGEDNAKSDTSSQAGFQTVGSRKSRGSSYGTRIFTSRGGRGDPIARGRGTTRAYVSSRSNDGASGDYADGASRGRLGDSRRSYGGDRARMSGGDRRGMPLRPN